MFAYSLIIILTISFVQSTDYYLKKGQTTGTFDGLSLANAFSDTDTAVDTLSAGDTLYIVGELSNPSFDPDYTYSDNVNDPHIWLNEENTIKLNKKFGTPNAWITIKPYIDSNNPTILRGDGGNIIRINNCSYIRIEGLTVEGQVQSIPLSTSKKLQFVYLNSNGRVKYRVKPGTTNDQIREKKFDIIGSVTRPSFTDTRGIYVSKSSYIVIDNNLVQYMPGGGIRVSYSEYVDITENTLHDNTRRSFSGTHALVVTQTQDVLRQRALYGGKYRVRVLRNKIYKNYNEIYSWVGTKEKIHPRIDEGKGVSLQRNQAWENGGRILVANNVAYWNGFSGIHSNDGDNIDMFGNTAFMNSYTNTITYAGGDQSGKNIGVSVSGGSNCRIANNIAVIDTSWKGLAISTTESSAATLVVHSNVIYGYGSEDVLEDVHITNAVNTIKADPKFVRFSETNPNAPFNPRLKADSPALEEAKLSYSISPDFEGVTRSATNPTIGAIETPQAASMAQHIMRYYGILMNYNQYNSNMWNVYVVIVLCIGAVVVVYFVKACNKQKHEQKTNGMTSEYESLLKV